MIRKLKVIAVGALVAAAGCSGSDSGGDDTTTPAFSASQLQGTWATCADDSIGPDYREVLVFTGSTYEFRGWTYPSTDGTCAGLPVLDGMDTGTFTLGAEVTVPNPAGAGTVAARQLDATGSQGPFYTIGWISADGNTLRVGDDSGANTGDTPALRPTTLQSRTRTRIAAPPSFAALLPGTFAACTDDPVGNDVREVLSFNGSALEVREYDHPTTNGTCGGDGLLNLSGVGGQGSFSLGAALDAAFGTFTVSATPVDFIPSGVGSTTYQLLWMDTYATTPTLYAGDDSDPAHDASAPGKRPIALQDQTPRYKLAAAPAFPAVLDGTWDACVLEPGAPNVDRWERLVISGTSVTFSEIVYASGDGTCTGTVNSTAGGSGTLSTGATTPATLGAFDVTANKIDVFGMFSIIHVDTMASPHTLYLGDEMATPGLDGTSDAKRPTVLQDWKPRFRQ